MPLRSLLLTLALIAFIIAGACEGAVSIPNTQPDSTCFASSSALMSFSAYNAL